MSEYGGQESTLVPGKLRGYRNWRLSTLESKFVLASINDSIPWDYDGFTAQCSKNRLFPGNSYAAPKEHTSPHPDCSCGIYGMYSPLTTTPQGERSIPVWGAFDAWGKIELGTKGFKAEKAKIVAIVLPKVSDFSSPMLNLLIGVIGIDIADWLTNLSKSYGAKPFDTKKALLDEFPASDLSEFGINKKDELTGESWFPTNPFPSASGTYIVPSDRVVWNVSTTATSFITSNTNRDVVVRWTP